MKKPLVIFGAGEIAQLAHYYFRTDSEYNVVAFAVDSRYMNGKEFEGLPLVAFEEVSNKYPPNDFDIFIALSYSNLNSLRKEKFVSAKLKGYNLASYISSRSLVLTDHEIGENCFILENNNIQPFVKIGDNVTLWSGNHIGHHSIISDHTFISSHVVVSGGVEIGEQCFIGVNVTLADHIKIGDRCVLGAGSILLKNAEAEGVYRCTTTSRSIASSLKLKTI